MFLLGKPLILKLQAHLIPNILKPQTGIDCNGLFFSLALINFDWQSLHPSKKQWYFPKGFGRFKKTGGFVVWRVFHMLGYVLFRDPKICRSGISQQTLKKDEPNLEILKMLRLYCWNWRTIECFGSSCVFGVFFVLKPEGWYVPISWEGAWPKGISLKTLDVKENDLFQSFGSKIFLPVVCGV